MSSPSSSRSRWCSAQRAHRPRWMRPGCPQAGQLRQNARVGAGAGRAERLVDGAAADRCDAAAAGAACPALLQARHQRLDRWPGRSRPGRCGRRSSRSAIFQGRQVGQSGPSGVRVLTGRRRPQPLQVSWLAGSVIKQDGHSGRPCSSRVAASRTAPQREHGSARDLATQLRQSRTPPRGLTSGMTRRQCGHGGRHDAVRSGVAEHVDQPQHRGTGASAPAPVSRSGRSCHRPGRAAVRCPARGAAAATAAATVPAVSVGRSRPTTSTMTATGSRRLRAGTARIGAVRRGRGSGRGLMLPQTAQGSRTGRRLRSTSPDRGAARCAAACRTRRRTAARSPSRRRRAARGAGPPTARGARGAAVDQHRRPARAGPGRAADVWPGRRPRGPPPRRSSRGPASARPL